MSNATLVKLFLAVLFLGGGMLVFSSCSTESKTKGVVDDSKRCPDCGREYTKGSGKGDCSYCKMERAQGKRPAKSKSEAAQGERTRQVMVGLIAFLICGASFLIYKQYRSRTPSYDEEVFHFRCPGCKRKIGFRTRKAGKTVMCPGCRKSILLPRLD